MACKRWSVVGHHHNRCSQERSPLKQRGQVSSSGGQERGGGAMGEAWSLRKAWAWRSRRPRIGGFVGGVRVLKAGVM